MDEGISREAWRICKEILDTIRDLADLCGCKRGGRLCLYKDVVNVERGPSFCELVDFVGVRYEFAVDYEGDRVKPCVASGASHHMREVNGGFYVGTNEDVGGESLEVLLHPLRWHRRLCKKLIDESLRDLIQSHGSIPSRIDRSTVQASCE